MSRVNRILLVLLLLQLGILVVSRVVPTGRATEKPHKLFEGRFDPAAVTRIRIAGAEKKHVELSKRGGEWVLASGGGYPVTASKVSDFLGKWPGLVALAPVADKPTFHRTLEVAQDSFQREITIGQSGKKDLIVYLGTSVGLKDVHLRFAGEDPVYLVKEVSAWDAGSSAADWVSTEYFKVAREAVVALELVNAEGVIKLEKGAEGKWTLADQAEGGKLKDAEVDALLSSASAVSLQEPVGTMVEARFGLEQPALRLRLFTEEKKEGRENKEGEAGEGSSSRRSTHELRLGAKEGDSYFGKSSSSRFIVRIASWTAETLLKKKTSDLLEKKAAEKKGDAAGEGMEGGKPGE